MKDMNKVNEESTNILYKGNVEISVFHGDKLVNTLVAHNTGLTPLFEFITHCLAGDFNRNKVPSYLRIFDDSATPVELTYGAIPSTTTPTYASDGKFVVITFNVTPSNLKSLSGIKLFKLYNKENMGVSGIENPSATFELTTTHETIASGSTLVVAWKMSVNNA